MAFGGISLDVHNSNGTSGIDISLASTTFQNVLDTLKTGQPTGGASLYGGEVHGTGQEIGLSLTEGGTPLTLSNLVTSVFPAEGRGTLYALYSEPPQAETITGFYLDGTEYKFSGGGAEYNAGQGISIGDVTMNARKGPSPDGFHVPSKDEWQGLKTIMNGLSLTTGDSWRINLHMPFAGYRNYINNISDQGSKGLYWSSSPYSSSWQTYASNLLISSSDVNANSKYFRASGFSVRCFKDLFEAPTSSWTVINGTLGSAGIFRNQTEGLISITSDGTTGYTVMDKNLGATVVYNDGDTLTQANMGNMYQWGNNYGFPSTGTISKTSSTQVDASSYGPTNLYSGDIFIVGYPDWSSVQNDDLRGDTTGTITQENAISNTGVLSVNGQTGDITIPQEITTPGLYWNEKLGLISISGDGATWMTIADKNLGATKVAKRGEAMSQDNMGNLFQWGNNYPFPFAYPTSTSTSTINASSYGPNNYYNNSTFRKISGNWDSSNNANLWGGTETNYIAKKGPCQFGWHIPTKNDINDLVSIGDTLGIFNYAYLSASNRNFEEMLFFYGMKFSPTASSWGTTKTVGVSGYGETFLCEQSDSGNAYAATFNTDDDAEGDPIGLHVCYKSYACSIRPFKNEGVVPTTEWKVIMQRIENKLSYSQLIALGSADNILSELNKDPKGYWESLVASGNMYEYNNSGYLSSDGTKGGAYKDGNNYIVISYGYQYPTRWGCYSFEKTTYIS